MAKKYRAKEYRLLNEERRTTRVIYTPQVIFDGDWCCFPDTSTKSGIIEFESKADALKLAKEMYEELYDSEC